MIAVHGRTRSQQYEGKAKTQSRYVIAIVTPLMNGAEIVVDAFDTVDLKAFLQREGIQIEKHRESMIDGDCAWYKLERTIAKKAWLDRAGDRQPVWGYDQAGAAEKSKVVSFYSFKGGMGRTTSLAASALLLAQKGYNVLAIDTDIEAIGLSSFFFDDSRIVRGTVDFFWSMLWIFYSKKGKSGLYFLDARAGFHDMGGVITFQIPHGVVWIRRDNRQSWSGIREAITLAGTTQKGLIPFILVDSMCDVIPSIAKQQRESFKEKAYTFCCDLYYLESEPLPGLEAVDEPHTPVYIPYNSILNEEICLYSDGSQEKTDQVIAIKNALCAKSYQELVQRICAWFGNLSKEGEKCNGCSE